MTARFEHAVDGGSRGGGHPRVPRRGQRRGQSLVITIMLMVVVAFTVFFTFALGERVRRKTTLQAMADTTAYSTAVMEARVMNFYAVSNRAIVSHLVSTLSVAAHDSWLSWYEDALVATVGNFLDLQTDLNARADLASCSGACEANLRDAARRARHIAEWYAFAMPRRGNRIIDSRPKNIKNLPGARHCPFDQPAYLSPNNCVNFVTESTQPDQLKTLPNDCYNLNAGHEGDQGNCLGNGKLVANGARGAQWFHDQYHAKVNGNWCSLLLHGGWDHANKMQMLRGQQLSIERDMMDRLLGNEIGQYAPMSTGRFILNPINFNTLRQKLRRVSFEGEDDGTVGNTGAEDNVDEEATKTPDFYGTDLTSFDRNPAAGPSLTEAMIEMAGLKAKSTLPSKRYTADRYKDAIWAQRSPNTGEDDAPFSGQDGDQNLLTEHSKHFAHRDFDVQTYAARFPKWIFEHSGRDRLNDENWQELRQGARQIAGGYGVEVDAFNEGVTKTSYHDNFGPVSKQPNDQGVMRWRYTTSYDWYGTNGTLWWDESPPDPAGFNVWLLGTYNHGRHPAEYVDRSATGDNYGRSQGIVSTDWGYALASMTVPNCSNQCQANSARKDQYHGRNVVFNKGTVIKEEGLHTWHGTLGNYDGHRQGAVNGSNDRTYPGHMRFVATSDPDDLYNQPFVMSSLTENVRTKANPRPWDFDVSLELFGRGKFQTIEGPADTATNNTMAAVAKALVYYHRPEEWREPPNLWNPYWRAKLHPLDWADMSQTGHPATQAALNQLNMQRAVNE
jgi:hypothetical protein